MDGKSLNVTQEKIEQLQQFLPEAFTEGKIDFEKLKLALGEEIVIQNERYGLSWAEKSEAFKTIQEQTTATLVPLREESIDFDTTGNIFIEGENLEVLKVLQKSYFAKIKMIYIDPPYNTGNDYFVYPDNFAERREDYLKRVNDKDDNGYLNKDDLFRKNVKENGQFHSNWLGMMYPRLYLARNLLTEDGVIFVSVDDNEVHNLRLLMDEVFGEENFLATVIWKKKTGAGAKTKGFITLHEYILCYFKNADVAVDIEIPYSEKARSMYNKKDEHYEELGPYATWPLDTTSMAERKNLRFPIIHDGVEIWPKKQWLWSKERVLEAQKKNMLVFNYNEKERKYNVRFKGYLYDEEGNIRKGKPLTIFDGPYTQEGTKDFSQLFNRDVYPFPKPVNLLKQLLNCYINYNDNKDDIILDFFAGSASTAHAILDLNKEDRGNRKFICVQLPENTDEGSEAYKAGYKTVADIGKERIRRVIQKMQEENGNLLFKENTDLGFRVFKLKPSNFKFWRGDIQTEEELTKQLEAFIDSVKPQATEENQLWELLIKAGKPLAVPIEIKEIEDIPVYLIDSAEMIIALRGITQKVIDEVRELKPKTFLCLDASFNNDNQFMTNTALQLQEAGIELTVI